MGLGRLLKNVVTLPWRGLKAGGEAIWDIFDEDEPEVVAERERRRAEKQARKQAEREQRRIDKGYFDNMAPRDPDVYGTGDRGFQRESDRRFEEMTKGERSMTALEAAQIMNAQQVARAEAEDRDIQQVLELMALNEARRNSPYLQPTTPQDANRQRIQTTIARRV